MLFRPSDSRAFAPFFDTFARLTGTRRAGASTRAIDGTFPACVIENGYEDVIGTTGTASTVRTVTVYIPRVGPQAWRDPTPPQRGDTVRPLAGGEFKITSVDATDATQYTMEARET
jgi:hypothetical protein